MMVAAALAVIVSGTHAQDARTKTFDDPNMNACWFGEASGCEEWARSDNYAAMKLICRQIGKADRCMPTDLIFDIALVVGPAQSLANADPDDPANEQNRFWLVLMVTRTADRARAVGSDAAIEGLKAAIAATVPERIRWDAFRQMLKEKGL
jgi:hypothetical protein